MLLKLGPARCEQKTAAGVVREAAKVLRLQVPKSSRHHLDGAPALSYGNSYC